MTGIGTRGAIPSVVCGLPGVNVRSWPYRHDLKCRPDDHKHRSGNGAGTDFLRGCDLRGKDWQVQSYENADPGEHWSGYEDPGHRFDHKVRLTTWSSHNSAVHPFTKNSNAIKTATTTTQTMVSSSVLMTCLRRARRRVHSSDLHSASDGACTLQQTSPLPGDKLAPDG